MGRDRPANQGDFQYSLRIVGFCDDQEALEGRECYGFQYSLRIVGFCDSDSHRHVQPNQKLSVFPANRGVLRLRGGCGGSFAPLAFSIPCESWGSATLIHNLRVMNRNRLSVFPANRGVLRHRLRWHLIPCIESFSIPCESWGSATRMMVRHITMCSIFQYSLRIVGFCDGRIG